MTAATTIPIALYRGRRPIRPALLGWGLALTAVLVIAAPFAQGAAEAALVLLGVCGIGLRNTILYRTRAAYRLGHDRRNG